MCRLWTVPLYQKKENPLFDRLSGPGMLNIAKICPSLIDKEFFVKTQICPNQIIWDFLTSSDIGVGMEGGVVTLEDGRGGGSLANTRDSNWEFREICHRDSGPCAIQPPRPILFSFAFYYFLLRIVTDIVYLW